MKKKIEKAIRAAGKYTTIGIRILLIGILTGAGFILGIDLATLILALFC